LDIQGHRGCRGLMPENTIEGFIKAVELGVNTLELDVVISKDKKIIVSHEAFFNHEITTLPDNQAISEDNQKDFNIFQMTYEEISTIDVGSKLHPKFPLQSKIKTFKPTLSMVVDSVEKFIKTNQLSAVKYNIEIKHDKNLDNLYHPTSEVFTQMVYDEVNRLGIAKKCNIQSFDPDCLNILHKMDSTIQIAFLVGNNEAFLQNLNLLTFTPDIYSPHYSLVDDALLEYCRKHKIMLIPWTVNEEADIIRLIRQGVDGIISDYPDKVIELYEGLKKKSVKE
jgi:glycerophosphoryl diester phosphodiesterase